MSGPRVALCLPGGGVTGAMFQIGALAALEDELPGFLATELALYVGASSGASVAAALAGGRAVERIYRAFLDPSDDFFPLERKHLFRFDGDEWWRVLASAGGATRGALTNLVLRRAAPTPALLWEELDRLNDSLPAGVFSLDAYERFLEAFFLRRSIPNSFPGMRRPLRIVSHVLDTGELVVFGAPGRTSVPVTRACIASMALPPLFSPVRIGDDHFIDAGAAQVEHLDVAVAQGAELLVVVNPLVPVLAESVPTGHGSRPSVRDKGAVWVMHQAMRMGIHRLLREACARLGARVPVLLIEPDPTDAILFMYNPASFAARRTILEHAYRTTRARAAEWRAEGHPVLARAGWAT